MHYSATHTVLTVTGCGTLLSQKYYYSLHLHTDSYTYSANSINLQIDFDFKRHFMLHKPEFAQYTFQYVN